MANHITLDHCMGGQGIPTYSSATTLSDTVIVEFIFHTNMLSFRHVGEV